MNKEELFQELSAKIAIGDISREEVMSKLNLGLAPTTAPENDQRTEKFSRSSVTKMFYVLGAAIVVIGIVIFVAGIWVDIGSFGRILVTLGLGLLMAAIGSVLLKQKPEDKIGLIFHSIAGMFIPGGAMVTVSELFFANVVSLQWPIAITFGIIFGFYLILNTIHKQAILTFFTIANGTVFIYLLIASIIGDSAYFELGDVYLYLTMALGVTYLLLGRVFRDGWNKGLVNALYLFGVTGFLGAAFSQVIDSLPWQLLYFLIVLGGLFLSVYLKSRSILIMSTLFLIAHISYITSVYFADSVGWPISLVILGFVFIGLGYTSVTINKEYINHPAA